jgi:hypothetical protein
VGRLNVNWIPRNSDEWVVLFLKCLCVVAALWIVATGACVVGKTHGARKACEQAGFTTGTYTPQHRVVCWSESERREIGAAK